MRRSPASALVGSRVGRHVGFIRRAALPGGTVPPPDPDPDPETDPSTNYATLPRTAVDVTMPVVTGTIWSVADGDTAGLQDALGQARAGDCIELEAGGTWEKSTPFVYSRALQDGEWILVRPSNHAALSAAWPLQADGMPSDQQRRNAATNPRMTPSRAAALTLPAIITNSSLTTIRLLPGSSGLYFWGIDFRLSPAWTAYNYGIIGPDTNDFSSITAMSQMPKRFIWNQCLARSPVGMKNTKAAALNINHHAFVNSYAESHHTEAENSALWMGIGEGPLRWENNAVVGSAINAFVGGVHVNPTTWPWHVDKFPRDITIKYNYFHTPGKWLSTHSAYNLAVNETKKNLLEFKIGGYVLIEGNLLDGSTVGSQNGQGLTLKVLNESYPAGGGTGPGPMTWSELHDVTVRYNLQRNTGDGWDILGNQQTTTVGGQNEGTQINRLIAEHNIVLCAALSEGYRGTTQRFGIWQAFPASDPVRGKKAASWFFRHNTFLSRGTHTFGVGFYMSGTWDTGWPRFDNNIFGAVNFRHFSADSVGSSAQVLAARCPGVSFSNNVFGKLSSGDNDFSNSFGNFEGTNVFLAGNTAIGVSAQTGELDPASPCRAGGLYDATDGTDNGADYAAVILAVSGLEVWE